jgi:hypothetical protein
MEKMWTKGTEFSAVGLSLSAEEFHGIGNVLMRVVSLSKENPSQFPMMELEQDLIAQFLA